jgi:hypothetical protein
VGLDITVLGKPLPGHEDEFLHLLRTLAIANGVMQDDAPRPGLLQRLIGKGRSRPSDVEISLMTDRLDKIATPPYAVVGAPVVGQDAAADAWAVDRAKADGKDPFATLAELAGYHVLELAPPCDGLPVYSHGALGYGVDLTSFRGEFIAFCTDALPQSDRLAAWGVMTAEELATYGQRLSAHATAFAQRTGLAAFLGQRELRWQDAASPEAQLHITDSLARWASYWGNRGHGAYPDF